MRIRPRSFGRSSFATIGVGALPIVATTVRVPIISPVEVTIAVPVASRTPVPSRTSMPRFSKNAARILAKRRRQLEQQPVGELDDEDPHLAGSMFG